MVVVVNTKTGLARECIKMPNVDFFQQKNVSYSIVEKKDFPGHCPPKNAQKWNMHPKVFLKFDNQGQAVCPYCGSKYELI